jgi:ammonium transporter, Amt family
MSDYPGTETYLPDYASYNWVGAPANFELATNAVGGDSSESDGLA